MKIQPIVFLGLLCLSSKTYASSTNFIYEADATALYGYSDVSKSFEKKADNNHLPADLSVNLGLEHEMANDYTLGIYLDLMAGIDKEIKNYNNGDWGQQVSGSFTSPYGRITGGETYNAAAQLHIGAPDVGALGIDNSDIVNFISNPNWQRNHKGTSFQTLNSTYMNTDGVAPKISYFTPEINNTVIGFSYVPDTYDRRGLINRHADYKNNSAYIGGIYHEFDLGFAELSTSGGFGVYTDNDQEASVGLGLSRGNWTISGGLRKSWVTDNDAQLSPDLSDGYREGYAYDFGASYQFGAYQGSLSYFKSSAKNSQANDEIIMFSNRYQLHENLNTYLTIAHVDFEGADKHIANNNQGYAFITGLNLSF